MLATFIVPVYNVEDMFLRECLDSLAALKSNDVEFIVIDDGSPDNAGSICDEYGENDSRFKIIHKKNEGVSAARNEGMKLSKGQYLTFIDADDWIESSRMDSLLEHISASESDIIVFGQYIDFKGMKSIEVIPFNQDRVFTGRKGQKEVSKMCLVRDLDTLKSSAGSGVFCNTVDKIIRADVLRKNKLYFNEKIRIGEDSIFYMELYQHCKRIEYKNILIYHYRMRRNSANHRSNGTIGYSNVRLFEKEMRRILQQNGLYTELREALLYRCYDLIFEQFSISYITDATDLWKRCVTFSREMEESPFREAIEIVDYKYMKCKEKMKAFLLKNHLQLILFLIFIIKRKGNSNNDDFY